MMIIVSACKIFQGEIVGCKEEYESEG